MHSSCHTENDFEICTASFPKSDTVNDKIDPSPELAVLRFCQDDFNFSFLMSKFLLQMLRLLVNLCWVLRSMAVMIKIHMLP